MTDSHDPTDEVEEEGKEGKEGKKGKGKAEGGAATRGEVDVQAGFYDYMTRVGASVGQISQILSQWRHLRGGGLARALVDFARAMTRASAHAEVEIAKGKDYGLIHNFIQHVKAMVRAPAHTHAHQNQHHHNKPEL